jgi:tRNA (mo5U34)-methyltransferase
MPRLSVKNRRLRFNSSRLSLTAEVPSAVADGLRRMQRRVEPAITPAGGKRQLVFERNFAQPQVRKRDARAFLPFFRQFHGRSEAAEQVRARAGEPSLADRVGEVFWYHTIDLPGGVVTPGLYDHRSLAAEYAFPDDLTGQRALDIATFDGFWAFELERRGAQVVATDIDRFSACDFPLSVHKLILDEDLDGKTSLGFEIAHEALGSKVERIVCNVYDLDPAVHGTFDLVHVADLLLHLESPLAALRAVRSVTKGQAVISDCFDPDLEPGTTRYLGGWADVPWWLPSLETLSQMVVDAGFSDVSLQSVYTLAPGDERGRGHWRALLLATP